MAYDVTIPQALQRKFSRKATGLINSPLKWRFQKAMPNVTILVQFIQTASKTHNHTFKTKLLQKVLKKIKRLLEKKLLSKSPKSALMETQIPY